MSRSFSFVIEHMEEDEGNTVPPWVFLEYKQMRALVEKNGSVLFTNLSPTSVTSLNAVWNDPGKDSTEPHLSDVEVTSTGVADLMKARGISLDQVCLLDPKAPKELSPEDGDGQFKWFLFGGILGDDPPRDRTSELRVLGFPTRHLGSVQMTTDTAVGVTKIVVVDKTPLNEIPYTDFPTIRFNPKESVEMPFRRSALPRESNRACEQTLPMPSLHSFNHYLTMVSRPLSRTEGARDLR